MLVDMNPWSASECHLDLLGRNPDPPGHPPGALCLLYGWSPLGASKPDQDRPPSFLWRNPMSAINDTLNSAGSILNDAVRFGIGLGGAILVAGILFDLGEYNIVTNVTNFVTQFTTGGLPGLITLLLIMTYMRRA